MPVNYTPLAANEAHAVAGVRMSAVQAHVRKPNRYDMLLIELAPGSHAGGIFTQSRFAAAPVQICRAHLAKSSEIRSLVINTGIANAATGELGLANANATCARVASALGVNASQVLPFSTGVILEHLPMDRINGGVDTAAKALANNELADWQRAAQTIMTTDTIYKLASERIVIGGKTVNITGIAKGAGMIQPNMATMLGFVVTDAAIAPELLAPLSSALGNKSFNRITIDGDTSTNDSFVLIATGQSKNSQITSLASADGQALQAALERVSVTLAQAIVRDGEGATKFMTIDVKGGRDFAECDKIARAVAHSPLVKTAFFASDPNLGRILAAVGYGAPADLDPAKVTVHLNGVLVAEKGGRAVSYKEEAGAAAMKEQDITVAIDLGRGGAAQTIYTCDFSYDYVKINADYRS